MLQEKKEVYKVCGGKSESSGCLRGRGDRDSDGVWDRDGHDDKRGITRTI